jgi:hypothetical protein
MNNTPSRRGIGTWTIPTYFIDTGLIILAMLISTVIVNPLGNFPLIDDWSYGRAVRAFLETGDYRPLEWASMPLFANVMWGALFCLPVGFSFTALRISTLVASALGLVGAYTLVRDMQFSRWVAVLTTLTLGANPIYYSMSNTFMTDILFTALAIWAAVFFSRTLRTGAVGQMLVGSVFTLVAALSRQLAPIIPFSFFVASLIGKTNARRIGMHAVPLALCVMELMLFNHWLKASGRLLAGFYTTELVPIESIMGIIGLLPYAFMALVYMGLFLLPVLLMATVDLAWSRGRRIAIWIACAIAVTIACEAAVAHFGFPFLIPTREEGIISKSGIGPIIVRDTFVLHLDHTAAVSDSFWSIVTMLGALGCVLLVVNVAVHAKEIALACLRKERIAETTVVGIFLTLAGVTCLLILSSAGWWGTYDRHLLPAVPFFAAGITALSGGFVRARSPMALSVRAVAFALLFGFSTYAIAATRDFLTANRVRWQALGYLTHDSHVVPEDIDGGFEFNGFYLFDPNYVGDPPDSAQPGRSDYWVHKDTYLVGFGPVPGYSVIKEYQYRNWLPPHLQSVVVLRKDSK